MSAATRRRARRRTKSLAYLRRLDRDMLRMQREADRREAREQSHEALVDALLRERWRPPAAVRRGITPRWPIPRRPALVTRHRSRQLGLYRGRPRA